MSYLGEKAIWGEGIRSRKELAHEWRADAGKLSVSKFSLMAAHPGLY
jgi:hypothetical protein